MPAILSQLGFRKAVGVYCDGRAVHAVRLVGAIGGARELERISLPVPNPEQPGFDQVVQQFGTRAKGAAIVLGVPTEKCYFATRPISLSSGASPKVLLRESLRSAATPVDRMSADTVAFRPDKRDVVGIAACDQGYIAACCAPLAEKKLRVDAAEPAPSALLRLAEKNDSESRRERLVVRVFMGQTDLLTVLAFGSQPIVWRTSPLAHGDEAATILALVRSLMTVAGPCGVERNPDAVIVHGRPDLERLVDVAWIRQRLGITFRWVHGPEFCGGDIAHGLALRGLEEESTGFNLAPQYAQGRSLLEMFPWRQAAACAAALVVMAGLMWRRSEQVAKAAQTADEAAAQLVDAAIPLTELERRKKDLQTRVTAVEKFLDSRVLWSRHFREIAGSLPENIFLTSFDGASDFQTKTGAPGKRVLVIKGAVSLSASGLVPHEVDRVVDRIRGNANLVKDFPVVELADLKQFRQTGDTVEMALFSVMCMPKQTKKKPAEKSTES
jgi:hypothetical protein